MAPLRAHMLQHVPFEGLGSMEPWLRGRGARLTQTRLWAGDPLPDPSEFDWLIAMGGPMSVNDEADLPWLAGEKRLVAAAIDAEKRVLGICLGAQLIASSLGAAVRPGRMPEIGWWPVRAAEVPDDCPRFAARLAALFDPPLVAFHWHGETFDLPAGAARIASSDACENQGFVVGDHVLGLQFHLETTPTSAAALVEHCSADLEAGPKVQSAEEILEDRDRFAAINRAMGTLLEEFSA